MASINLTKARKYAIEATFQHPWSSVAIQSGGCMSDDSRFEYDSMQDVQSIQKFLQTLNEGFKNGKIVLSSDKEKVVLRPQHLLKFAIKAKKKGNKCKLSLKMSWKEVEIADSIDSMKIGT